MVLFNGFECACAIDSAYSKKMVEKKRVFKFLTRLNKELDEVCGWILSKETLPSIREMFVEVRREENRTSVMMGGYSSIIHENSTIVATDATASVATNLATNHAASASG